MPVFDDKIEGKFKLFTRDNGVSRLGANYGYRLYSYWNDLVNSYLNSRVVRIDAEGVAREKLDTYIDQLQKQRDAEVRELDKRFKKAKAILKRK